VENLSVTKISSGFEHCLAISSAESRLFSWGWNEHGNCGNGNTINCSHPTKVGLKENFKVVDCFAGSGHSFAVGEPEK
jgi:secretion-regulating guanine nucleotide exchange factor